MTGEPEHCALLEVVVLDRVATTEVLVPPDEHCGRAVGTGIGDREAVEVVPRDREVFNPLAWTDGTSCHSQDDDRSYHSVQATLGEDTAEKPRSLLNLSVNADWDQTVAELDDIDAVTDDATVVSDAESRIVTAVTDKLREHQADLIHVGRTLEYNLWDDGI